MPIPELERYRVGRDELERYRVRSPGVSPSQPLNEQAVPTQMRILAKAFGRPSDRADWYSRHGYPSRVVDGDVVVQNPETGQWAREEVSNTWGQMAGKAIAAPLTVASGISGALGGWDPMGGTEYFKDIADLGSDAVRAVATAVPAVVAAGGAVPSGPGALAAGAGAGAVGAAAAEAGIQAIDPLVTGALGYEPVIQEDLTGRALRVGEEAILGAVGEGVGGALAMGGRALREPAKRALSSVKKRVLDIRVPGTKQTVGQTAADVAQAQRERAFEALPPDTAQGIVDRNIADAEAIMKESGNRWRVWGLAGKGDATRGVQRTILPLEANTKAGIYAELKGQDYTPRMARDLVDSYRMPPGSEASEKAVALLDAADIVNLDKQSTATLKRIYEKSRGAKPPAATAISKFPPEDTAEAYLKPLTKAEQKIIDKGGTVQRRWAGRSPLRPYLITELQKDWDDPASGLVEFAAEEIASRMPAGVSGRAGRGAATMPAGPGTKLYRTTTGQGPSGILEPLERPSVGTKGSLLGGGQPTGRPGVVEDIIQTPSTERETRALTGQMNLSRRNVLGFTEDIPGPAQPRTLTTAPYLPGGATPAMRRGMNLIAGGQMVGQAGKTGFARGMNYAGLPLGAGIAGAVFGGGLPGFVAGAGMGLATGVIGKVGSWAAGKAMQAAGRRLLLDRTGLYAMRVAQNTKLSLPVRELARAAAAAIRAGKIDEYHQRVLQLIRDPEFRRLQSSTGQQP